MTADDRAMACCLALLTDDQRNELKTGGEGFTVRGSLGTRYFIRVNMGIAGNVWLLDDAGKMVKSWCAYPPGVPHWDVFAAQKLALETDEPAFLNVAYPAFGRALQPGDMYMLDVDIMRQEMLRLWAGRR